VGPCQPLQRRNHHRFFHVNLHLDITKLAIAKLNKKQKPLLIFALLTIIALIPVSQVVSCLQYAEFSPESFVIETKSSLSSLKYCSVIQVPSWISS
jgi:hypothetical protein